ncbi:unnamed protein product [Moneuplotes crassus]|uniref:Uncharacterized protein n=1 Tax=Euplotes crassus TaxID=5936 RepID=A0AAD2D6Y1_EUPCR|nr:unnamed protein product [Moneuplotes crassus]
MSDKYEDNRKWLQRLLPTMTSLHYDTDTFNKPQFSLKQDLTDKTIFLNSFKMLGKCALVTFASAGFGFFMGLIMSSFEFNRQMHIDTDRSTRSQLKQQFFGYGRFLKRQSLGFMKFGFYISLIEIPLELAFGKITTPAIILSGGLAAVLLQPRDLKFNWRGPNPHLGPIFMRFLSSGMFIGLIGMYMNKGNDTV